MDVEPVEAEIPRLSLSVRSAHAAHGTPWSNQRPRMLRFGDVVSARCTLTRAERYVILSCVGVEGCIMHHHVMLVML